MKSAKNVMRTVIRCDSPHGFTSSHRPGEGRPFSRRYGSDDGSFCQARRLSLANSASSAFCLAGSASASDSAFLTDRVRLGVLGSESGLELRRRRQTRRGQVARHRNRFTNSCLRLRSFGRGWCLSRGAILTSRSLATTGSSSSTKRRMVRTKWRNRDVNAPSLAFGLPRVESVRCSPVTGGRSTKKSKENPFEPGIASSPSRIKESGWRRCAAETISGNPRVRSLSDRDCRWTPSPWRESRHRNPSHFGS
jgi:hypothetical protein